MAGRPGRIDFEQDRVRVTIDADFAHALHVA
jgi:hypothetical protein